MVKKKSKIIFPIVIIIIIIASISSLLFFTDFNLQEFGGGFTVLSVSKADFTSSASELNFQEAYLIDVVVNKGGESLTGEITRETLSSFGIPEDKLPAGDFKIDISLRNNTCNYQIIDDELTISKIYQATGRYSLVQCAQSNGLADPCPFGSVNLETVKDNCRGTYERPIIRGENLPKVPEFCDLNYEPQGTENPVIGNAPIGDSCDTIIDLQSEATFSPEASEWCYAMPPERTRPVDDDHWRVTHFGQNPWYQGFKLDTASFNDFVVDITLTNADGEQVTATITPKESTAIVEDILRVKFAGSLVAEQSCPVPAVDTSIVRDVVTDQFKEVDKSFYEAYKVVLLELINLDNNFFAHQGVDPGVGFNDLTGRVSSLNAFLRKMVDAGDFNKDCIIDSMQYKCQPQSDVIYPEIQLVIKADFLGINLPSGIPRLSNINLPSEVFSGEITDVGFTIENIGEEDDSFDVTIECEEGGAIAFKRVPVSVGESITENLEINGDVGSQSCTMKAVSVNNPFNSDEINFQVNFKQKDLTFLSPFERLFSGGQGKTNIGIIFIVLALIILSALGFVFRKDIKKMFKKGKKRK